MNHKRALFLDRDGTIISDAHYLHKPEDIQILKHAREGLLLAQKKGYELYLFTNQSGIGRGYYTMEDAIACNAEMLKMMKLPADLFAGTCIAPEAPDQISTYRKPSPAFLIETIEADQLDPKYCWMIGDKPCDWEAGIRAGINAAAVTTGKTITPEHHDYFTQHKISLFKNLLEFAQTLPSA